MRSQYLKSTFTLIPLLSVLAMLSLVGCSSKLQLTSHWRDRDIKVDGANTEWQDGLTFVEKENVAIGVFNDDTFLYLSLLSTDRSLQRQMTMLGFTLWFDPDGGKDKTFGIRFPIGRFAEGSMLPRRWHEQGEGAPPEGFEESLREIEIIGPEKNQRRLLSISDLEGIEIRVDHSFEALCYEIKVPLQRSEQYLFAIDSDPGKQIGVGFETTALNRETMREKMGRGGFGGGPPGGPGGGKPGGIGGVRPGGRGGMGGQKPQMPEQFKLWASVKLSSQENIIVSDNKK